MSPSKVSRADSSVYLPAKPKKKRAKKAKTFEVPSTPGKTCPNCEQEYVAPDPGDSYIDYPRYDVIPHPSTVSDTFQLD